MGNVDNVNTASSASGSSGSAAISETVVQPSTVERPLLTTSFSDYTVSEGLLLMILLALIVGAVIRFFRG